VEAVMEGEFDVFGEALSSGDPDQVEMVGQLNALRIETRSSRGPASGEANGAERASHQYPVLPSVPP
jgi:hypothetical protein